MYFKDTLIAAFSTHPNEDCRKAYFLLIVGIVKTNFGNNLESTTPSLSTTQSLSSHAIRGQSRAPDDHDIDTQMIDERAYASDIICMPSYIFPSSPEEVPFRNLVVDTSWTINAIMQPMFSAQSILLSKDGHSESQDLYTVHENSIDTSPNLRRTPFLVPRIPVYYDKSKKNLLGPSEKYRDSEFALLRGLKRVYVKRNAAEERDYFSAKALRLKSKIQKAEHLQKLARSRQVNLSRSYRVGEYPDMKIKPSSFLKPLWTLTQRDADISKFVLSKLVSSIMISSKKDGCSSGIIDDRAGDSV
ncbi:hypothetical protein BASA62_006170 [Batrachochytrium salamandrivorans]|nr:hypothetical protein BASA62_006170 [Batrachochytrium salamandrivorans]